jgi:8-oxo-dGTP pyrophosphatase MutT (NUDIX family)
MKKTISAGYCLWYFPMAKVGRLYSSQDIDFYKEPYVLLVHQHGEWSDKKKDYKKKSGTWSIPKGHVKDGETLQQCAVRELEEETCVTLGPVSTFDLRLSTKSERMSLGGKKENKVIHMFGHILKTSHEELSICTSDKAITSCGWYTFKKAKKLLHKSDFDAMQRLYNEYMWMYCHRDLV